METIVIDVTILAMVVMEENKNNVKNVLVVILDTKRKKSVLKNVLKTWLKKFNKLMEEKELVFVLNVLMDVINVMLTNCV